jgi:hypothetical protein
VIACCARDLKLFPVFAFALKHDSRRKRRAVTAAMTGVDSMSIRSMRTPRKHEGLTPTNAPAAAWSRNVKWADGAFRYNSNPYVS